MAALVAQDLHLATQVAQDLHLATLVGQDRHLAAQKSHAKQQLMASSFPGKSRALIGWRQALCTLPNGTQQLQGNVLQKIF